MYCLPNYIPRSIYDSAERRSCGALFLQIFFQILAGIGSLRRSHLLRRTLRYDRAAAFAALGTQVDNMV